MMFRVVAITPIKKFLKTTAVSFGEKMVNWGMKGRKEAVSKEREVESQVKRISTKYGQVNSVCASGLPECHDIYHLSKHAVIYKMKSGESTSRASSWSIIQMTSSGSNILDKR